MALPAIASGTNNASVSFVPSVLKQNTVPVNNSISKDKSDSRLVTALKDINKTTSSFTRQNKSNQSASNSGKDSIQANNKNVSDYIASVSRREQTDLLREILSTDKSILDVLKSGALGSGSSGEKKSGGIFDLFKGLLSKLLLPLGALAGIATAIFAVKSFLDPEGSGPFAAILKGLSWLTKSLKPAEVAVDVVKGAATGARTAATAAQTVGGLSKMAGLAGGALGRFGNSKLVNGLIRWGGVGATAGRLMEGDNVGAGIEAASLGMHEAAQKVNNPRLKAALAVGSMVTSMANVVRDLAKDDPSEAAPGETTDGSLVPVEGGAGGAAEGPGFFSRASEHLSPDGIVGGGALAGLGAAALAKNAEGANYIVAAGKKFSDIVGGGGGGKAGAAGGFFSKMTGLLSNAASKAAGSLASLGTDVAPAATQAATKAGLWAGAKSVGKTALKALPGVGLAMGAYGAYSRIKEGDYLGALGEAASGIAGLVPGIGTAAAVAIQGGLAYRDITKASAEQINQASANNTRSAGEVVAAGTDAKNNVTLAADETGSLVKDSANSVMNTISSLGSAVSGWIGLGTSLYSAAGKVLSNLGSKIWDQVKEFSPFLTNVDNVIKNGFSTDNVKGLVSSVLNMNPANMAVTAGKSLFDWGKEKLGFGNNNTSTNGTGTTTQHANLGKARDLSKIKEADRKKYDSLIDDVYSGFNFDDSYKAALKAQIGAESNFNPNAGSEAGARGMTQFIPATAKQYGVQYGDSNAAVRSQIVGQAKFMQDLNNKYKSHKNAKELAFMAYNWGPGNVDKWLKRGANPAEIPEETRNYIATIFGNTSFFLNQMNPAVKGGNADTIKKESTTPATNSANSNAGKLPAGIGLPGNIANAATSGLPPGIGKLTGAPSSNGATVESMYQTAIDLHNGKDVSVDTGNTGLKLASNTADYDIDKICSYALSNAKKDGAEKGDCALYVRKALQAGARKHKFGGLGDAKDYVNSLPKIGWTAVGKNLGSAQKGDIAVFPKSSNEHNNGHVCIFTGGCWVSDFKQQTVYPNSAGPKWDYIIYRANSGNSNGTAIGTPGEEITNEDGTVINGGGSESTVPEDKGSTIEGFVDKAIAAFASGGASLISTISNSDLAKGAVGFVKGASVDKYETRDTDLDLAGFDTKLTPLKDDFKYTYGNAGEVDRNKLFDPTIVRQKDSPIDHLREAGKINGIVRQKDSPVDWLNEAGKINGIVRQKDSPIDHLREAGKINGIVRQKDSPVDWLDWAGGNGGKIIRQGDSTVDGLILQNSDPAELIGPEGNQSSASGIVADKPKKKKKKWYEKLFGSDKSGMFGDIANSLGLGKVWGLGQDIYNAKQNGTLKEFGIQKVVGLAQGSPYENIVNTANGLYNDIETKNYGSLANKVLSATGILQPSKIAQKLLPDGETRNKMDGYISSVNSAYNEYKNPTSRGPTDSAQQIGGLLSAGSNGSNSHSKGEGLSAALITRNPESIFRSVSIDIMKSSIT